MGPVEAGRHECRRDRGDRDAQGAVPGDVRAQIESELRDAGVVATSRAKMTLVEMIELDDDNGKPDGFTFYKEGHTMMSRIRSLLSRLV